MPEKDGDEGKSTKSVVNKKQKQMMGEEGYDIARDMGRVRPSKDKKDATTMPVSDEVKKTQKVNKGPSAFERVKAKYGKSVMNVGKKKANEELDLTKVAESFGGYIVEAPSKDEKKDEQETNKNNQNKKKDRRPEDKARSDASAAQLSRAAALERKKEGQDAKLNIDPARKNVALDRDSYGRFDPASGTGMPDDDGTVAKGGKVKSYRIGDKPPEGEVAKTRRKKAEADKKQRISDTLRTAKPTDIKGGPSVKRGDPVPQKVIPVKKKPVPEIGGFQPNTFKGFRDKVKTVTPDKVIPPKGDPLKVNEPQEGPTIDVEKLPNPARKRKSTFTPPAFATRIGASGKPLPVSMRNVRVPRGRSIVKAEPSEIEKLKPSQKGNIIVRTKTKTRTQDPGIDPEVTSDSPNQRRAGVGNRTLPGKPPKTGPGFGKRFGDFMNFTRKNPVASLIGYDILRKTAGGIKNQLKPVGVRGGKAIRVSAGR